MTKEKIGIKGGKITLITEDNTEITIKILGTNGEPVGETVTTCGMYSCERNGNPSAPFMYVKLPELTWKRRNQPFELEVETLSEEDAKLFEDQFC